MPEQGGSTAQSGFFYQNSAAALFLVEMIGKPDKSANRVITRVNNEARDEGVIVDDILVKFKDGHQIYVQVKEKISVNSEAWKDLWNYIQRQVEQITSQITSKDDRILLFVDQLHEGKKLVNDDFKEICCRARGHNRRVQINLSGPQDDLFKKIKEFFFPLEDNQNDENISHSDLVVSILSYVDVEFSTRKNIDETFSKKMPECNVPAPTLLRILRDIAAESAIYKTPLEPLELRRMLDIEHNIKIEGIEEFALLPFEPVPILIDDNKEFLMGNDDYENEAPKHRVVLKPYYISKYPVTKGQFAVFISENPSFKINQIGWKSKRPPTAELDQPVVGVTFLEAYEYCRWLSKKTKYVREYRLPNEAEWEKAARGNEGNKYPWGDKWDEQKFRTMNGNFGCCEMVGNISEWTCSLWGKDWEKPDEDFMYKWEPGDRNDPNADITIRRVIRGLPYNYDTEELCCSNRGHDLPYNRGSLSKYGFRVAMDV